MKQVATQKRNFLAIQPSSSTDEATTPHQIQKKLVKPQPVVTLSEGRDSSPLSGKGLPQDSETPGSLEYQSSSWRGTPNSDINMEEDRDRRGTDEGGEREQTAFFNQGEVIRM